MNLDFERLSKTLPHEIAELDFIGDHMITLGVPARSSEQFKKMVLAGAKTYNLGNRSVDNLLKSYGDRWTFPPNTEPFYVLFRQITQIVIDTIRDESARINSPDGRPDLVGLFASGAALYRLFPSFSHACLMLREGLWIETACILKLILEQISWSYSIHHYTDDSLFKTSPTKSISSFKNVVLEAGILYGILNKLAHLSPEETIQYISFDDHHPKVFLSSRRQSAKCAYYLLHLVDMYLVCSEMIFHEYFEECHSIRFTKHKGWHPKKSRPMRKIALEFRRKLMKAQQDAAANP